MPFNYTHLLIAGCRHKTYRSGELTTIKDHTKDNNIRSTRRLSHLQRREHESDFVYDFAIDRKKHAQQKHRALKNYGCRSSTLLPFAKKQVQRTRCVQKAMIASIAFFNPLPHESPCKRALQIFNDAMQFCLQWLPWRRKG